MQENRCCEHCVHANEDHDMLVRINEKMEVLSDHEKRIRNVERIGFIGLGILYAIQFYQQYVK